MKPHEYYGRLLNSAAPLSGYRVLCHNCNASLGLYGYCPHRVPEADQATQSLRLVGSGERSSASDAEEDADGFDTAAPQLISDFARGAL